MPFHTIYDDDGNLLKDVEFEHPPGGGTGHPVFKWTYTYSPSGMLIETAYYNVEGDGEECTGRSVNHYAGNGTLSRQDNYGRSGSLEYRESYSRIKLDSRGHWVERVVSRFMKDGKMLKRQQDQVEYRTITYY